MTVPFTELDADEADPLPGLFFLDPIPLDGNSALSAGVAFLIAPDGLLVTCAHVAIAINRVPGEIVVLRAASPDLPIQVQAEVLAAGWKGPDWESWSAMPNRLQRNWLAECDARPDVFKQDHALLRIIPGSARWDTARGEVPWGSPEARLREQARVLPLAAPGYAHNSRPQFQQWRVVYELGAPNVETAYSEFLGVERSLHDVLQVRSTELGRSYSGSPIWDPRRRRVVGMVRRWLRHAGTNALGVDARAIARLSGVELSLDPSARRFIELARRTVEAVAPLRHFPLLESFLPPELLRLRVRAAGARDLLEADTTPPTADALQALRSYVGAPNVNTTIVRGGAGAGKSTLLYQFADDLLSRPMAVGGMLAVPFFVTAPELRFNHYDVARIVALACQNFAMRFDAAELEAQCISQNDLCVVLLVDGIDEIEPRDRTTLLARLRAFAGKHSGYRVVATTRPLEDRDLSMKPGEASRMAFLELLPLENDDVEQFATTVFPDEDKRRHFRHALAEIEWDRSGPLPLQLAMAARAFEAHQELGGRPVELQFRMVQHLLDLGRAEREKRVQDWTPEQRQASAPYLPHFERIVQRVALAYLDGYTTRDQVAHALQGDERFKAGIDKLDGEITFLERESGLRGALLHFTDREGTEDKSLVWPHRTIPEALAAKYIAWLKSFPDMHVGPEIDRLSRAHGNSFGVVILGALDEFEAGRLSVDRYLMLCLDRGKSEFKSTVFAMRALGASIAVGDAVRSRLVKTMVALLLLSPKTRLGTISCAEVFSLEDTPDMADLANRPRIRPLVIAQLLERWKIRARGTTAPIRLSPREELLLDRLGLWHEIPLRFATPERASPATRVPNLHDSGSAAFLLSEILERLGERADHFMVDFAGFVRSAPPDADPVLIAHEYLRSFDRRNH